MAAPVAMTIMAIRQVIHIWRRGRGSGPEESSLTTILRKGII
jgi:TRAP-type C4-dicarboxylate transport system permease small subunit